MKKLSLLLFPLLLLSACRQNEPMDYALDGRVYFNDTKLQNNVTVAVTERNYSFALQNSALMQDTILIPVRLMGNLTDTPRTFRAEAVADSTTAETPLHYELLDGILPAGQYEASLPVLIKRTADTQDHYVSLLLRIVDTPDLAAGNADALTYRLNWGDILMRPANWPYFFGTYSVNKYRFAIDVLGLTDWPQASRTVDSAEEGIYTAAQLQLFAARLNEAYQEYRKTHGPIYVDDNAETKVEIYYAHE